MSIKLRCQIFSERVGKTKFSKHIFSTFCSEVLYKRFSKMGVFDMRSWAVSCLEPFWTVLKNVAVFSLFFTGISPVGHVIPTGRNRQVTKFSTGSSPECNGVSPLLIRQFHRADSFHSLLWLTLPYFALHHYKQKTVEPIETSKTTPISNEPY